MKISLRQSTHLLTGILTLVTLARFEDDVVQFLLRKRNGPLLDGEQPPDQIGMHIDNEVMWRQDGTALPCEYRSFPIMHKGECSGAVVSFTDISERLKNEEFRRLAAKVFDNVGDGLMITDADANIVLVNKAFTRITGYSPDEVIGRNPRVLQSGKHDQAFYESMWKAMQGEGHWQDEIWDRRKNGEIFPVWEACSTVRGNLGEITHYVSAFSDISAFKETEARLQYLAHHDPLTELPNRMLFAARCELSLQNAARRKTQVGVLFMDLDGFKPINDRYGHEMGDEVLKRVAQKLQGQIRKGDTACRIGGDEFAVLLTDINQPGVVERLAGNFVAAISEPMDMDGQEVSVSCSIGISLYPEDGKDMDTLLSKADTAMYQAKASGKNRFVSSREPPAGTPG